jgi:hypothetical protein
VLAGAVRVAADDGVEWIHQNHVIRIRLGESADYHFISRFLNSDAGRAQILERTINERLIFSQR